MMLTLLFKQKRFFFALAILLVALGSIIYFALFSQGMLFESLKFFIATYTSTSTFTPTHTFTPTPTHTFTPTPTHTFTPTPTHTFTPTPTYTFTPTRTFTPTPTHTFTPTPTRTPNLAATATSQAIATINAQSTMVVLSNTTGLYTLLINKIVPEIEPKLRLFPPNWDNISSILHDALIDFPAADSKLTRRAKDLLELIDSYRIDMNNIYTQDYPKVLGATASCSLIKVTCPAAAVLIVELSAKQDIVIAKFLIAVDEWVKDFKSFSKTLTK